MSDIAATPNRKIERYIAKPGLFLEAYLALSPGAGVAACGELEQVDGIREDCLKFVVVYRTGPCFE